MTDPKTAVSAATTFHVHALVTAPGVVKTIEGDVTVTDRTITVSYTHLTLPTILRV